MSAANKKSPYLPKYAIFQETGPKPELFNETNNRLERLMGQMNDIIYDVVAMKNIVMGEVQKLSEKNDQNHYNAHTNAQELISAVNNMTDNITAIRADITGIHTEITGIHTEINNIHTEISSMHAQHVAELQTVGQLLYDIKEKLTAYEVEPDDEV